MERRAFLALVPGSLLAAPLAAEAQPAGARVGRGRAAWGRRANSPSRAPRGPPRRADDGPEDDGVAEHACCRSGPRDLPDRCSTRWMDVG
jgi:hypothetical protein